MTQHQSLEEKKRQFEEAIIDMAVAEHHKYCMVYKRAKSEAEAKMFYTAMRLGVTKGIEYATKEIQKHNEQLDKEEANGNNK